MIWIKYRTTHASGNGSWSYKGIEEIEGEDVVERFIQSISDYYIYSDKFRGVEYELISIEDVPDTVLDTKIGYERTMVGRHASVLETLLTEFARRKKKRWDLCA